MLEVIQDYWVLFALGLLLLVVVRMVFKALFKVAMVVVLIAFVAVFVFNKPLGEVLDAGKAVTDVMDGTLESTVMPLIEKQLTTADYTFNPDGTYEVRMSDVRITGKKGEPTATVHYGELSFNVDLSSLDQVIQKKIQESL